MFVYRCIGVSLQGLWEFMIRYGLHIYIHAYMSCVFVCTSLLIAWKPYSLNPRPGATNLRTNLYIYIYIYYLVIYIYIYLFIYLHTHAHILISYMHMYEHSDM